MLLPILKHVAIIPVKANTIGDNFIRIHRNMYIPNIYRLSTEKIKWLSGDGYYEEIIDQLLPFERVHWQAKLKKQHFRKELTNSPRRIFENTFIVKIMVPTSFKH